MRKLLCLVYLFAVPAAAFADVCNDHLAYATANTATVSTASAKSAQNGAVAWSIYNPFDCTTTGIAFAIRGVDRLSTNFYGFALVGVNGNAVPGQVYATTGAVPGPIFTAVGVNQVQSLPWTGGPVTLPVGMYMVVLGTTCTTSCATLYGDVAAGQFFSFIYPNTTAGVPWTFTSGGFGTFSSVPQVSLNLSASAPQTITGTTATVALSSTMIGHIHANGSIQVAGVTTAGATGLNCTNCLVTAVDISAGTVSYKLPAAGSFCGLINDGATLAVAPVMVQQGINVPPVALIY